MLFCPGFNTLLGCHHRPRVDPPSGEKLTHLTGGE
jgi:hypothetical protein